MKIFDWSQVKLSLEGFSFSLKTVHGDVIATVVNGPNNSGLFPEPYDKIQIIQWAEESENSLFPEERKDTKEGVIEVTVLEIGQWCFDYLGRLERIELIVE